MRKLNIGHKLGGKIIALVAITHSTPRGGAEWHFVGKCESSSHDPDKLYDIPPSLLCLPRDGRTADLELALAALSAYLSKHGTWRGSRWLPHTPQGREEITL